MITITTAPAKLTAPAVARSARLALLRRRRRLAPAADEGSVLLSVLIPCYNVEPLLGRTVNQTIEYLRELKIPFEVVIADDGSTDRTAEVIEELQALYDEVQAVRLDKNRGKGAAVRAAFAASRGRRVIFMDADGATALDAIPIFLDAVRHGDVVIASRHHPASHIPVPQPFHRRVMGFVMRHLVQTVTGLPHQDTQCGFKLFRREIAEQIFQRQQIDRFAFDVELCFVARRLGYKVLELPVTWRNGSHSSVRALGDSLNVFLDVFRIRLNDVRGLYR